MIITYLFHSGFAVELKDCILIFDYWHDSDLDSHGYLYEHLLPSEKRIYVLCSHVHEDHFNPDIFTWREKHPDIVYILSRDILRQRHLANDSAHWLLKGDEFNDEHIFVKAFGSTDVGISFYVRTNEGSLFHAGDLNNWHWSEESTPEEIAQAGKDFLGELKVIKRDVDNIDVVMFPVDARIGGDYALGARQFISQIKAKLFIPMHFSAKGFETIKPFKADADEHGCKYWMISHEGEQLNIDFKK